MFYGVFVGHVGEGVAWPGAEGKGCDQGQSRSEEASAAGAVTYTVTVSQAGGHIASQEGGGE